MAGAPDSSKLHVLFDFALGAFFEFVLALSGLRVFILFEQFASV